MSVNYDKHSVEKRHNQRFLGVFLMFAVVAVVIGLMTALSITGYGLFDIFKTSSTNTAPAITPVHSSNGSNGSNGSNAGNIINCTDTDGGIEPYIFGIVTFGGKTYSDFCWKNGNQTNQTNATNVLAEFYCWNNKAKRTLIYCPYGCSQGKCLNITNAAINPSFVDTSQGVNLDNLVPGWWQCRDVYVTKYSYSSWGECEVACPGVADSYCRNWGNECFGSSSCDPNGICGIGCTFLGNPPQNKMY